MYRSRRQFLPVLAVWLGCCLLPAGSWSQQSFPQSSLQTQTVKLGMIVTDDTNHSIDDVKQEDIEVVEQGAPQKISLFARDDRPVQYVVAVDNSGSFRSLLKPTLAAVKLLIENNRPEDQTMLLRFISSDRIERAQDFTSDKSKLLDAFNLFRPEGGQTAVIDAVYIAAESVAGYRLNDPSVRRALVLFSDGEERNSYYREEALFKLLREQDVQVFIVGIVGQLDEGAGLIGLSPRQKAQKLLKRLAEETGGRVFSPNKGGDLQAAMSEIIHDLHSQYVVGFEKQAAASEKGFRELTVKRAPTSTRKKFKIITRSGYWLNTQNPLPQDPGKKSH